MCSVHYIYTQIKCWYDIVNRLNHCKTIQVILDHISIRNRTSMERRFWKFWFFLPALTFKALEGRSNIQVRNDNFLLLLINWWITAPLMLISNTCYLESVYPSYCVGLFHLLLILIIINGTGLPRYHYFLKLMHL